MAIIIPQGSSLIIICQNMQMLIEINSFLTVLFHTLRTIIAFVLLLVTVLQINNNYNLIDLQPVIFPYGCILLYTYYFIHGIELVLLSKYDFIRSGIDSRT